MDQIEMQIFDIIADDEVVQTDQHLIIQLLNLVFILNDEK